MAFDTIFGKIKQATPLSGLPSHDYCPQTLDLYSMSDSIGDPRQSLFDQFVEPQMLERLQRKHSEQSPGIPFAWILSYRSNSALQNIRYFENGVRHCQLQFPIRVFMSKWTAAIVVSFVPLEAIKEPHVQEWYASFYELSAEEAKTRLAQYPDFPYDGRNADLAMAELHTSGEHKAILQRSKERLRALGVPLIG